MLVRIVIEVSVCVIFWTTKEFGGWLGLDGIVEGTFIIGKILGKGKVWL